MHMVTYVFKYVVNDMDLKWSVAAAKRSDDHQEMQKKIFIKKIPYISKSVALLDPYEGYLHVQIHLVQESSGNINTRELRGFS